MSEQQKILYRNNFTFRRQESTPTVPSGVDFNGIVRVDGSDAVVTFYGEQGKSASYPKRLHVVLCPRGEEISDTEQLMNKVLTDFLPSETVAPRAGFFEVRITNVPEGDHEVFVVHDDGNWPN